MFSINTLKDVEKEAKYAMDKWGDGFDDKNTLNDWITYICLYASDASRISIQDDPDSQYAFLIKAAGLALNAAHRIKTNTISGRHYDIDRSNTPDNVAHGQGRVL